MPIKKDESGQRWVEMEFVTPGTPEQVWQAMATGPGYAAWFTRATIEERAGGALQFHFGPDTSTSGEVTTWDPPHRFGYVEKDWSPGAPPVATEITITSRSGNQCVVRMVHSLFSSTDDWDDQMEGFEQGWPSFFDVLRIYLAHFAGMKAASFGSMTQVNGEHLPVWLKLIEAAGLANANAGERRTIAVDDTAGVVEHVRQDGKIRVVILRIDTPAPGVLILGTYGANDSITASASVFTYGDDADSRAARAEQKWIEWVRSVGAH